MDAGLPHIPRRATGFAYHEEYLDHDTGYAHPECAARLTAIMAHFDGAGLFERLVAIRPAPAAEDDILRVHTAAHLDRIRSACSAAPAFLDGDTPVSHASFSAALLAAGAALQACDAVMRGEADNAFCAVRPPGHHAEPDRAMGFCLFNSVAIAARHLQHTHGLRRILIVDWDVHHGNGTQTAFWTDPSVLYASIHQRPLYPGSGAADERGSGAGEGTTLNIPLPPGSGDDEYRRAFDARVLPAAEEFQPDFILVSAGFDAHADDPLAQMRVSTECFGELTDMLLDIADRTCHGRVVSVLEGGYNLDALARSAERHVRSLLG